MTAKLIRKAFITVPLLGKNLDESKIITDPVLSRRSALLF
jgi:hypothetical protein